MEQEQEGENPQQTFCEYSIIRDIVLKVLKAQGIPNPSDEVIDSAIKEHLTPKVLGIINKKLNSEKRGPWKYWFQELSPFWQHSPTNALSTNVVSSCALSTNVASTNTDFTNAVSTIDVYKYLEH